MRFALLAATTAGLALTVTACVSVDDLGGSFSGAGDLAGDLVDRVGGSFAENFGEAPRTPMTVVTWDEAPEGPYQARAGEHLITQYLAPRHVVELTGGALPARGQDAEALAPGAVLFGVVGHNGAIRYCAAPDAPSSEGQPTLTCLEDVDGDGAFDAAWTALGYDDTFALAVRRWVGRRTLVAPAGYVAADPLAGPLRQVAIEYVGRGRGDAYGFALNVGGQEGFTTVGGATRASWVTPQNGAFDIAGARIEILSTSRRGQITYRLGSSIDARLLTLQVSNAQRSLGVLALAEETTATY
ncbi:MAG: hypothetical protein PVI23_00430 [Maricaulaceae bacterium]|jgi:hypothetical protein